MRLVRVYPDPDPILRFFVEDSIPNSVWAWPAQERSQRLRYALINLCAGNHALVTWPLAFDRSAEVERDIEQTLEQVSDADIERMVADSRREAKVGLS